MMDTPEREGHRQRLREKFLQHGLEKFTDEEIVELLLTLATPRRDCKQSARDVLGKFKTLRNVLEAELADLTVIKGIGPNNAFGIKFIHQITRKFLRERMMGRPYLNNSEEVLDYLNHAMRGLKHEVFRVIYLSAAHEIVDEESIAAGTATEVPVTPRQIVERAVKGGAAAIVLAHNHPGGEPLPSDEDRALTRETGFTAAVMGVRLLEHLIIAPGGHFSFAAEGILRDHEAEYNRVTARLFR